MTLLRATAFAPASVGNVGVGFDVLGFAVEALGDRATVTRTREPGVTIVEVRGVVADLPREAERNTAGRALLKLRELAGVEGGFALALEKGIPLGSGLGGSGASAVAAAVAGNALLERPLGPMELLECALAGESLTSGARNADNVASQLFGGLVLTVGDERMTVKRIPVPAELRAVVVHPHLVLETKAARAILRREVALADLVRQSANLAGVIAGCCTNDVELIRVSLEDVVIEPQRARLVPGFARAKAAAREAGALGCSLSGSGPTVFAWALAEAAERVRAALIRELERAGHGCDHWIVPVESAGARVLERG